MESPGIYTYVHKYVYQLTLHILHQISVMGVSLHYIVVFRSYGTF